MPITHDSFDHTLRSQKLRQLAGESKESSHLFGNKKLRNTLNFTVMGTADEVKFFPLYKSHSNCYLFGLSRTKHITGGIITMFKLGHPVSDSGIRWRKFP